MIVLIAKYFVKPGNLETVLGYLREMAPEVEKHEPGCKFYTASISQDQEDLIILVEHYEDEAAFAGHRDTPHFQSIIEGKIVPLLDKREREVATLAVG